MHNKHQFHKALIALLCLWGLLSYASAHDAYHWHYRNLDSVAIIATENYGIHGNYENYSSRSLNDLAFVDIAKMEYGKAEEKLNRLISSSRDDTEKLIAYVQMMRICQRRSMNQDFYVWYNKALRLVEKYIKTANPNEPQRLNYAISEFYIVASTYYYYVGMEEKSHQMLFNINPYELIKIDSAQTVNFCYNIGADGDDFFLNWGYELAKKQNLTFFIANILQVKAEQTDSIEYAQKSLDLFLAYGDVYQVAGAYRTLANCQFNHGEYEEALVNLKKAINFNPRIDYAPDLLASIHERLSVVYAALGNMEESIYNRNEYLTLQEGKRQDRFLESRTVELKKQSAKLNAWIMGVIIAILVLLILLIVFFRIRKRIARKNADDKLTQIKQLQEDYELLTEQQAIAEQNYLRNYRRKEENRAKISLVNSIMPLIDRMLHDMKKSPVSYEYIDELAADIENQNEILTNWIQLRQGELSLKIETFPLQPLFDIVAKAKTSCALKGIELDVETSNNSVKADRILTLFMLNTLVDNARKFTPEGGTIKVSSKSVDNCVELSVADTGKGISEEELSTIFTHKIDAAELTRRGHGFGLLNCKGIIEKYKKTSTLFHNVMIAAESEKGKGTRFFFRLPKGKVLSALLSLLTLMPYVSMADKPTNDSVVSALQNNDWKKYNEANAAYIQALKEKSIDKELPLYYQQLQNARNKETIAIVVLIVLLFSIVAAYYLLVLRFKNKMAVQQRIADRVLNDEQTKAELLQDEIRKRQTEADNLYVSNNVIDNCLSTLKHETMYYPSRIRKMIAEQGNDQASVLEMTTYYKELYTILDEQAMREYDKFSLHLECVEICGEKVFGDRLLLNYLFDILGCDIALHRTEGDYVVFQLNTAKSITGTPDYYLIRQIIRDHSQATGRHRCGLTCDQRPATNDQRLTTNDQRPTTNDNLTTITIILPHYGKV